MRLPSKAQVFFNPKEPGLFGQLNTRGGGGGWNQSILGNIVELLPIFILNHQTVSHLKVDEVEIAASGGCQSGQGPGEKKFDQKNLGLIGITLLDHKVTKVTN